MKYFCFPLMLVLFSVTALAQTRTNEIVFADPGEFVKSILKEGDALGIEARGDLNSDGLEDWVGIIERNKPEPADGETFTSKTSQLYVLLRRSAGGYQVAEQSKEEPVRGMGCCWVENLEIKRSSLFIQNNAKTANTMEAATHQFKFYRNEWRLVGLRIFYLVISEDFSTETDMNLLTGAVIVKKQKGEKKAVTTRRQKKFPRSLLKDFDFFNGFGME